MAVNGAWDPSTLAFSYICLALRCVRFTRAWSYFRSWDVSWADGSRFQALMMVVILVNSLLIAVEDYFPGHWLWAFADHVVLTFFLIELIIRFRYHGKAFFCTTDCKDLVLNWFDLLIVAGGVFDEWLMPVIFAVRKGPKMMNVSRLMMTLRLVRVMRILRLVRLIKKVKPLSQLVLGIQEALQGMGWVLLLTGAWLYIGALLFVKLVGHGIIFGGENEVTPQVRNTFPNVPTAMWVLFKVMNGESGDLRFLFEVQPAFKLVIAIFMIISSWAILSILTAVVSENMIKATERENRIEREERAKERARSTKAKLEVIFEGQDLDKNGVLTREEFQEIMHDKLVLAELCAASDIKPDDVEDLFHVLTVSETLDGEPCINMEDWIEGLMSQGSPPTSRSLLRLEKRLTDTVRREVRSAKEGVAEDIKAATSDLTALIEAQSMMLQRSLAQQRAHGEETISRHLASRMDQVQQSEGQWRQSCMKMLKEIQATSKLAADAALVDRGSRTSGEQEDDGGTGGIGGINGPGTLVGIVGSTTAMTAITSDEGSSSVALSAVSNGGRPSFGLSHQSQEDDFVSAASMQSPANGSFDSFPELRRYPSGGQGSEASFGSATSGLASPSRGDRHSHSQRSRNGAWSEGLPAEMGVIVEVEGPECDSRSTSEELARRSLVRTPTLSLPIPGFDTASADRFDQQHHRHQQQQQQQQQPLQPHPQHHHQQHQRQRPHQHQPHHHHHHHQQQQQHQHQPQPQRQRPSQLQLPSVTASSSTPMRHFNTSAARGESAGHAPSVPRLGQIFSGSQRQIRNDNHGNESGCKSHSCSPWSSAAATATPNMQSDTTPEAAGSPEPILAHQISFSSSSTLNSAAAAPTSAACPEGTKGCNSSLSPPIVPGEFDTITTLASSIIVEATPESPEVHERPQDEWESDSGI